MNVKLSSKSIAAIKQHSKALGMTTEELATRLLEDIFNPCPVKSSDVAEVCEVSRGAVSFALNDSNRISDEKRAQIKAVAKKMGYRKNMLGAVMQRWQFEKKD